MAYGGYIQSVGVDAGTGTTAEITYSNTNTLGNTLFLTVRHGNTPGTITLQDLRGNAWSVIRQETTGTLRLTTYYVASCAAGANTLTLSNINSVTRRMIAAEYEGASLIGPTNFDVDFGQAADADPLATSISNALLIVTGASEDIVAYTAGDSFTERQEIGGRVHLQDKVVSVSGTYNTAFTLTPETLWVGISQAFHPAAGKATQNTRAYPLGTFRGGPRRGGALCDGQPG